MVKLVDQAAVVHIIITLRLLELQDKAMQVVAALAAESVFNLGLVVVVLAVLAAILPVGGMLLVAAV